MWVQAVDIGQNFFILEIGGAEVVLGTNWLASLGDIEEILEILPLNGERRGIKN